MSNTPGIFLKEAVKVPVESRLTADRTTQIHMMSKITAELKALIPPVLDDAQQEIEFCFRYLTGELKATANLSVYGYVSGGRSDETCSDRALRLLPVYYKWKEDLQKSSPMALRILSMIIIDGKGLRQAGQSAGLYHEVNSSLGASAGRYLLHGLNEYSKNRGWGDVMGGMAMPYFGYIYIIGGSSSVPPYKIGYSCDPKRRLKDLQVASPVELKCYYVAHLRQKTKKSEKKIHKELKDYKVRGEWFDIDINHIVNIIRIMYPDCIDAELH